MGSIRDTSEKLLSGELTTEELSPMTPRFELETVTSGVHFVSSFANVTAFETRDGMVLVDVGSFLFAERTREVLRSVGHAPVTHAIYTHGHVDHCFGVELYEAEPEGKPVHVVAHRGVERRFERYAMTRGYNSNINRRQFQTSAEFPGEFRRPDQTFEDALTLEVGGRSFELHHAMGETDDHTWVFEPESRVLCTGDLFIWASPNCGNPQKVQRYPLEWATALRAMAALEPEVLCPGHGVPIWGRDAVNAALTNTASYLESIVHQVLALLNEGARLDAILGAVRPPSDLERLPYLRPVYDEPEFIVRNVVRLYGGWWDGNPANLKPARERDVARELTVLVGGVAPLVARAEALAAAGDLKVACHLIEIAAASPDAPASVFDRRRKIYAQRAAAESSLMARGIFGTAARE
jgi:alkyl sulfatase BDS1-like metallo-beta-lactamase superfamily hydrolase